MKQGLERFVKYLVNICAAVFIISIGWASSFTPGNVVIDKFPAETPAPPDTILPFPFNDNSGNPYDPQQNGGLYLNNPSNIKEDLIYDPDANEYTLSTKIGELQYRPSNYMSFEEYQKYDLDKSLQEYWQKKTHSNRMAKGDNGLIPKLRIGGETFDRIFGSNTIDIRPSGSAELIFGVISTRTDNPALDVKQRRNTNFDFQEKIQMNVTAKIGDKIQFGVNYNTEASFDFENKMNLKYEGKEDEIIQLIEAGDVTLPLNSTLITGSQALFGIKTKLKFGRTTITGIYSQQKSKTENITVSGGAQTSNFDLKADQYEENKHFFIAQFFRNNYNTALKKLPVIQSPVNITKMEVWITNVGAATQENRNIVAFQDIGEPSPYSSVLNNIGHYYPDNEANDLWDILDTQQIRNLNTVNNYLTGLGFKAGIDFEKVELARKLNPSEYSFNSKLGFISLNTTLNTDQVLAVAFQYTLIGDTTVYQVGEFSNEGVSAPNCLAVKLLKSTSLNTKIPMWDLMMKNVYAIGGYQINPQDFRLNVLFSGEENGVPMGYLTEGAVNGIPLIKVLGCDRLNSSGDPVPDGVFDFIGGAATQGGTIQETNGRVFFPVLEPFGQDMRIAITGGNLSDPSLMALADKYCYDSLYSMTKTGAQQYPDKNKFSIAGFFKSAAGAEISLGAMNVPQGSVKVTAGGIPLAENVDYTVDYTLGRVKIINEGILNSGTPINISLESNNMFDIQTKTLLGAHVDYMVNKNFNLGATVLNLSEKPLTQKVNFGDEPISNTIWGINGDYQTESRLLTKIIDWLPFLETKAASNISAAGEFAQLIPGHSKAIGSTGTSYIDDFEGSKSSIDLRTIQNWFLASTPQYQTDIFPEGSRIDLAFNMNRARLAWYVIDPSVFYRGNNQTPANITKDDISNHFVREVFENEVFPQKDATYDQPQNIAMMNLAYYPEEVGPYNYDVDGSEGVSSGIDANGKLKDPETRWGGITRKLETTDFEATNVEYIEFWMMDPFVYNPSHTGGYLYFDLGDISEDVLRDSRKSVENGIPSDGVFDTRVDTTIWGIVPNQQPLTTSFDANEDSRQYQDVGLDGLNSANESNFFKSAYLDRIAAVYGVGSVAYAKAAADPSSDDYHYFRGPDYDSQTQSILQRYKKYNNTDGNSPTDQQSFNMFGVDYPMMATTLPDGEDINRDNTLNESERYFQYRIELRPAKMVVGENYITDVKAATSQLANGTSATVNWYQFKIPVQTPDRIVNGIQDFKSIRFLRMFLQGFSDSVICRFATLDLVRSEWRRYKYSLLSPGEYIPDDNQNNTTFDVSAVNIEENSERVPVPYVVPPGIEREINVGATNLQQMNEQSLDLKVCNLLDGDSRAVYKTCDFDMRQFKKLKMFVHGEAGSASEPLADGDLTVFIRLGSDFTSNYYEYEVPVVVTPWGTAKDQTDIIWPGVNDIEISLEDLVNAKKDRNTALREDGSPVSITTPYITYDAENRKIVVVGNPSLSAVKTIMLGIRNPKKSNSNTTDDGNAKCAEIWVNELRLTDFAENGGWAATARINAALADFGNLSLAGTISTPGFGSIDKKINERSKETVVSYDIATNLELGKFFPEKWGLKIPMHYDFSELRSTPQYNPINPDIVYKEDLSTYSNQREKDSIRKMTQDYTRRQSLNFMNVRKTKVSGSSKAHIWDVENLDLSYAFTEVYHRNVDIEYDVKKTYRGGLGYNFAGNPKAVKPFDKVKFLNNKYFRIVKDFNFYYMPKLLSFRTDLDKQFSASLMRNKTNAIIILEPTYIKLFNWTRDYGLKWDLTQNLKIDFNANANARVDEPPGRIEKSDPNYKAKKDSVWNNLLDFGRLTTYQQNLDVTYTLPINKLPFLSWVTATAKYGSNYQWMALPLTTDSLDKIIENPLGNTIENSNTQQLNINANLVNLYNYIPYLKKINDKRRQSQTAKPKAKTNMPGAPEDSTENKINWGKEILDNTLSLLMSVKSANVSYQENNGKMLPGFMPKPTALGMDWKQNAPGMDFVFGNPSEIFGGGTDIRDLAFKNNWMSTDTNLNTPYSLKQSKTLNGQVTLEPLPALRIDVTMNSTFSKINSSYLRSTGDGYYKEYSPIESGSYSMSYITWGTAFVGDNKDNSNAIFEKFKEYRLIIATRLSQANPLSTGLINDSTGFPDGYGPTSQEVLIPAFLAAYAKKDPDKISLKPFSEKLLSALPLPNWKITYTGLTKIKWIKKYFKNISVSHSYRNTYSVGSYVTSVRWRDEDGDGYTFIRDAAHNYLSQKEIGQISINEQFSPLIGFDMTMVNSLLIKFEIRKTRNLALSFANTQLTEVTSEEYVIGAGYRIKDVSFNLNMGGRKKPIKSDLNLKADFSIRSNKTMLRKLVENMDQVSAGQRVMSISVSADYQISEKFNIRLFFDKIINNPFVTSQYRNSNTNAGISLKFTLAQ